MFLNFSFKVKHELVGLDLIVRLYSKLWMSLSTSVGIMDEDMDLFGANLTFVDQLAFVMQRVGLLFTSKE